MKSRKKRIINSCSSYSISSVKLSSCYFRKSRSQSNVNEKLVRVACLGDSITNMTGYPEDLQKLLGNNSLVGNFGVIGATVNF